ncbi:MAG TPA: hypothetical protein DEF47_18675 [Herpetosiphon sp.]|nr:FBP domain-containing protein [Herpetosiphon sp.]HBW51917.1 hypothetical protein [Herpetosiphon sp.]
MTMDEIDETALIFERSALRKLFRKAEDYELPLDIRLSQHGFYHWLAERTNRIYLVWHDGTQTRGIVFNMSAHAGKPFRQRQCDLCGQFVEVGDMISVRSLKGRQDAAYQATYSYICADLEDCRGSAISTGQLNHFLNKHRS